MSVAVDRINSVTVATLSVSKHRDDGDGRQQFVLTLALPVGIVQIVARKTEYPRFHRIYGERGIQP